MATILSELLPANHNAPVDPFEAFKLELDSLFEEAGNFLDGEPIANQQQADDISAIINRLRKAVKDADAFRADEKRPHDEAAKVVQEKWLPSINRGKLALDTAKSAISAFLLKLEDEQRAAAEAARQEAEDKAAAARKAVEEAGDSLAAREKAEAMLEDADKAEQASRAAEKAKVHAKGGERAVGLRSTYLAEIIDPVGFGKWAWEHRRDEYLEFLTGLAAKECRHGPKDIPGVKVHEDRKAV